MTDVNLLVRDATIVDGTGGPARRGSVAVDGDRIVAVGEFDGTARRTIDAGGRVVAPGFIDIHTHYDAQLCWDDLATPSLEHGCTTVVTGNCGLSLAPVHDEVDIAKIVKMFWVIEDIGEATFAEGVPWAWRSFPEYLSHIGRSLGPNVGALVGHSALRWYVMGPASQERTATPTEVAEMGRLLREAMDAGAIGISTSYVDVDDQMRPVPSQWSDHAERLALAKAMAASGRGVMQTVPRFFSPAAQLAQINELARISRQAGVMCTLAPIVYSPVGSLWSDSLRRLDEANASGAKVYGQSMTRPFDINMRLSEHSFLLLAMPSWRDLLRAPLAERERRVNDPEHREVLVGEMDTLSGGMLEAMWIGEVVAPENAAFRGQRIPDVAAALGVSPGRALVEVATADGLRTEFQLRGAIHGDPDRVAEILDHPSCLVGASDAGAHISQFCGAGDTTYLLGHHVRERGDFTLERAVHRITGELAAAWGIADRGELRPGAFADLVLFDPQRVDRGPEEFVQDVPGAANRYIRRATGIDLVAVNGEVVVDEGEYTAARPGRIV